MLLGVQPVFFCLFSSPVPFSLFTCSWMGPVGTGPKAVFVTSITTTMKPKIRLKVLDIIMARTYQGANSALPRLEDSFRA